MQSCGMSYVFVRWLGVKEFLLQEALPSFFFYLFCTASTLARRLTGLTL